MATASSSLELPVLHVTTITEASIDAGRAEYERRARVAATSDVSIDFDDVVIAEHLSSEQFGQVPDDWLRDLRVLLRADDTLVITKLETNQYRGACSALRSEVRKSVRANGLFDHTIVPLQLSHGALVTPDVLIYERANDPCRRDVPIVLFDVEVHGRSIQHVIGTAAFYLSGMTKDERVVSLQFFPPLQPDLDENGELCVPALAVVFRAAQTGRGRIQVEQMRSFGNAAIPASALRAFVEPGADSPLEPFAGAVDHSDPDPPLREYMNAEDPYDELMGLLGQAHSERLVVELPAPRPAISINLVRVFVNAMLGWRDDRQAVW